MAGWTTDDSRLTYRLDNWGEGYVGVGENGQVLVRPYRNIAAGEIDMAALLESIEKTGVELPVLIRFQDILKDRINLLCDAFKKAYKANKYNAKYTAVYPIKVNQQFSVVDQIIKHGQSRVGLEAGSKPELMAVLSVAKVDKHVIICNGYKDHEYIRLALIARKLGHKIIIVLEKSSELNIVLDEAKRIKVEPMLGLRLKLSSIGKGKWQNTGGEKSKFGLSAEQILNIVDILKEKNGLKYLQLLHFHMGSQIADLSDIKNGVDEAAQYFVELQRLGLNIKILDIGGGVGVDYEGQSSENEFSVNYTLNEYAEAVVSGFSRVCEKFSLQQPDIITEAGRAMTAHHAVLVTEVINAEQIKQDTFLNVSPESSEEIELIFSLYKSSSDSDPVACFNRLAGLYEMTKSRFNENNFSIEEKMLLDKLIVATYQEIKKNLSHDNEQQQELLNIINEKLADKLVCNFSVFQSVPDIWGISQVFPIVPLQRLNERPDRRAIIQDLTCDSDGQIEKYVDRYGIESSLPVHELKENEKYRLGIFMVGAYQEILGDMHNLFGDTNTVNVELDKKNQYKLAESETGDTVLELLNYVHFDTDKMMKSYQNNVDEADITVEEAEDFLSELYSGLEGYTYLE